VTELRALVVDDSSLNRRTIAAILREFEFLQLLMDRHPLPVIVVSGLSAKENIFRALELGAIDFIEKPQGADAPLESLRTQLVEKVQVVQQLSPLAFRRTSVGHLAFDADVVETETNVPDPSVLTRVPSKVIVIGASTGGPKALITLFRHLRDDIDAACHPVSPARLLVASTGPARCKFPRPGSTSASPAGMPMCAQEGGASRSFPPNAGLPYAW